MIKKGHRYMKKILNWIPIIIAVLAIFLVYLIFTQKDRKSAINVAEETLQYLKNGCIMYDNYSLGRESKDLMTIRSAAGVLTDYFGKTELTDEAWLTGYAENQNLTGIILTDQNGELLAESEAAEYGIWTDILKKKNILDIAQNARKTYAEHIKLEDSSYDYAIASAPQILGLILVYRDTVSSGEDDNDITLNMLVSGYNFDMDAAVIITDEDIIRSSNIPELPEGLALTECPVKEFDTSSWGQEHLIQLEYNGNLWYGGCSSYKNYQLYAFFPQNRLFNERTAMMGYTATFVIFFWFLLVMIRFRMARADMNKIQSQFRTIRAISSIYTSNILIQIDKREWEPIKLSEDMQIYLKESYDAEEMLQAVVKNSIAPKFWENYRKFADLTTMRERLGQKNSLEYDFMLKDGKWYSSMIIPQTRDESGNVVTILLVNRDISEEKKRELDGRQRLRYAMEQEQRANAVKTDFLRRMSHDIRTPINGIRGMVSISNHHLGNMQKQRECNEKILRASGFLLDLVNDVLDMNKLESGEIKLENRLFNMTELLQETADIIDTQAVEAGVAFVLNPYQGMHDWFVGSPLHFRQIIQNIMSNAVKYNREKGFVEVSCQEISNDGIWSEIKFTCVDTGIGMSREFQKHVFDPFAQEQSEARTRYAGTGLGLAIVKELVEQMGGKIEFSSEKGIGTVFIVTLKLKISSTIPEQEKKEKTPEKSIAGTRVLLVEDNDLNMEIAEFMLANANVQVVCAWNGQQAVELFEQSQQGEFDLILMDIMMPVMNGLTAAKTIRGMERKDAAEIPIIAMTANAFSDDIEQSREAGMNEHLSKPLDAQKLVEVIRKYIF